MMECKISIAQELEMDSINLSISPLLVGRS